jgi:hypothetical protein
VSAARSLHYLGWQGGPDDLVRLGALVLQARMRVEYLDHLPDDAEARRDLVRLIGAIAGLGDRQRWDAVRDGGGALVRILRNVRGAPLPVATLQDRLTTLERLIHQRIVASL